MLQVPPQEEGLGVPWVTVRTCGGESAVVAPPKLGLWTGIVLGARAALRTPAAMGVAAQLHSALCVGYRLSQNFSNSARSQPTGVGPGRPSSSAHPWLDMRLQ